MIPGDRVGGRFEVEQWVGAGGMGAVYRARDLEGGGLVAIKVLLSAGRLEEARFEREVEALAGLRHPGIVRYVAHGQTEGGAPWLAMEWLAGEDLAQRLARGRLDVDASLGLVRRVAEALREAAGESDPVVLAAHFEHAGDLARALPLHLRGAEQALRGNDLASAIGRAERGLACSPEASMRGDLLQIQAEARFWRGELPAAEAAYAAAAALFSGGSARWYRTVGQLMTAVGQRGDNDGVEPWLARAVAADPGDDPDARVICLGRGVSQLLAAGRVPAVAVAEIERAASLSPRLGPHAQAWVHRIGCLFALRADEPWAAMEQLVAALVAAGRLGDARTTCLINIQLGTACLVAGDFDRADEAVALATALASRLGAAYLESWARYTRGKVAVRRGELVSARSTLARVLAEAAGSPRIVGGARVYLAVGALAAGDLDAARAEAEAALALPISSMLRVAALAAAARAAVAQGRVDEARSLAHEITALRVDLGPIQEFESFVALAQAEAFAAAGERALAASTIAAARARILTMAAHARDLEQRNAFLSGIEEHASILALARELGVDR